MLLNDSIDDARGFVLHKNKSKPKLSQNPITQSLVTAPAQRMSLGAESTPKDNIGLLKEQLRERDETINQLSLRINEDGRRITELEHLIDEKETLLQEMEEHKNALLNELLSSSGHGSK